MLAGCADDGTIGLADLGFAFREIPMENKGTDLIADFRTLRSFYRLYKDEKPDAVLHFNSKPDIYGSMAAALLGIPSISNITGLGMIYVGPGTSVRKLVNLLYRIAFAGRQNTVFFQNEDDRELFVSLRIVSREKSARLPGSGVDINAYSPCSASNRPSTNDADTRFLFASRLVLSKGIREFIRAAEIVRGTRPNARFEIVGELLSFRSFIPREELDAAIAAGTVTYYGNERNVRDRIADSDCIVLPSYYREGVPRILLEGAAMAKPLIAADSVGTREPVRDGVNGYLCLPESADDLAAKMLRFADLDGEAKALMGLESRRMAEERFSDSIVTKAYLNALAHKD